MATPVLLDSRGNPMERRDVVSLRQERQLRARFDAAQTTDENRRHWANADYLGPNAELSAAVRRQLRSRARYECANNTYASGMLETLANDTIGTGPTLQMSSKDEQANSAVENAFWEWMQATKLSLKFRTMKMTKTRDGETFASFYTNRRLRTPVKLDIQPHEPEMVADPYLSFEQSVGDGILLDDNGNVSGYTLLRDHPGEMSYSGTFEYETIRPRDMIHLFFQKRAGQLRGYSEITPALPLYAQLRRFTLAVLRSAESAALFSWFLKTQSSPEDVDDLEALDTLDTERGMGVTLPRGWEMQQLKAEQPTSTYEMFKRAIIAEIARCLNMPYNVAAGDSSSYNYASGRLDHKTYYKSIRVERAYWESVALDVIFERWWDEARLVDERIPESLRDGGVPSHEWRWDGDEHVDPTKEANAAETRLRMGLTSYADECSKLGLDFEVVHAKNAAALGLAVKEYRKRLAGFLFNDASAIANAERQAADEMEEANA